MSSDKKNISYIDGVPHVRGKNGKLRKAREIKMIGNSLGDSNPLESYYFIEDNDRYKPKLKNYTDEWYEQEEKRIQDIQRNKN